jgi:CRISPR system Cascade subunit CasD
LLLEKVHAHLQNPTWLLFLGRKSYVPSEPIWIENGVQDAPLLEVLIHWPWIATKRKWEEPPEKLLVSWESEDETGTLKMDQLLYSFAERRFGSRFVRSQWIPFPKEASNVSA